MLFLLTLLRPREKAFTKSMAKSHLEISIPKY